MSKSNQRAKKQLIERYGAECFIDKLHLRKDTERKYTGKKQYNKMKQLTYHHIFEKRNGGKATLENGALLSDENHQWFNKQSSEEQARMNDIFQKYKYSVDCGIEFVNVLNMNIRINAGQLKINSKGLVLSKQELREKERNRRKREMQRLKKEYEDR